MKSKTVQFLTECSVQFLPSKCSIKALVYGFRPFTSAALLYTHAHYTNSGYGEKRLTFVGP